MPLDRTDNSPVGKISTAAAGCVVEVRKELVGYGFFVDGTPGRAHRLMQLGFPWCRHRVALEGDGGVAGLDARQVVACGHPPWPCAVAVDDLRSDGNAWPVEVAVVRQLAAGR